MSTRVEWIPPDNSGYKEGIIAVRVGTIYLSNNYLQH